MYYWMNPLDSIPEKNDDLKNLWVLFKVTALQQVGRKFIFKIAVIIV